MKRLLFILLLLLVGQPMLAQQPQWKFPLAFEDATGAKDTLFFVWDSAATGGYDTAFGEIPMSMLTDTFQVYIGGFTDSLKTWAISTNINSMTVFIKAKNYILPIKMSWDTVVLNNSNLQPPVICCELDNEYFFLTTQNAQHTYSMLPTDTATLPSFNWGSQNHFPLTIYISREDSCSPLPVTEIHASKGGFTIYPNPTTSTFTVQGTEGEIQVYDLFGSLVLSTKESQVDMSSYPAGIYFVKAGEAVRKLILN